MTIAIYETTGHLTDAIPADGIAAAQKYLQENHDGTPINMEGYLDKPLCDVVVSLRWFLDGNGYDYRVEAICSRELTEDEQRVLSLEVSGQNSDGLGEGFEQQDFAWIEEPEEDQDCAACNGQGEVLDGVDDDGNSNFTECTECDGQGYFESNGDDGRMCSFDWQTNELPWTRIK